MDSDASSQIAVIVPPPKPLDELMAQGYRVNAIEYLKQGWRNFWQYPIGLLAFALLFTILSQVPLLLGPWVGQFLSLSVTVVMMTGIALLVWKQLRQRPASFLDLFPGWQTIGQLVLCTIVGTVMTIAGLLLFVVPGIYLMVAYTFSFLLIADRGMGAWEALETSRRVVSKNWWGVSGLIVLTVLLIAGGIVLGGLFLGAPLGAILAKYYPVVNVAEFFTDPPAVLLEMNVLVNQGMVVGVVSGIIIGMGLGMSIASCMLGVAYADIFGLVGGRPQSAEESTHNAPSGSS
jgi:hypothetical protein